MMWFISFFLAVEKMILTLMGRKTVSVLSFDLSILVLLEDPRTKDKGQRTKLVAPGIVIPYTERICICVHTEAFFSSSLENALLI